MNFMKVELFLDYFELNYHNDITKDTIEGLTGVSYDYFRNMFKKITGISIGTYIKRRKLALIIHEVIEKNGKISNFIKPYLSIQSFSTAFKNEYLLSPQQCIEDLSNCRLQPRINICNNKGIPIDLEKLVEDKGSIEEALFFLLSLPPIKCSVDEVNCERIEIIVREHYQNLLGWNPFRSVEVPAEYHKKLSRSIMLYYDFKTKYGFKKIDESIHTFEGVSGNDFDYHGYYLMANRDYIKALVKCVDVKDIMSNINLANISSIFKADICTHLLEITKGAYGIPLLFEEAGPDNFSVLYHIVTMEMFGYESDLSDQDYKITNKEAEKIWDYIIRGLLYFNNPDDEEIMKDSKDFHRTLCKTFLIGSN